MLALLKMIKTAKTHYGYLVKLVSINTSKPARAMGRLSIMAIVSLN
jgi:hypothetical protein